jgi:hypothetical protein
VTPIEFQARPHTVPTGQMTESNPWRSYPMSVTYPADATATTYLFTLRGKVNTPTVADARELHNKTAGSADGIAAARALGDLSHNVYTSAGNGAGSDEVLIIDYWNSPSGVRSVLRRSPSPGRRGASVHRARRNPLGPNQRLRRLSSRAALTRPAGRCRPAPRRSSLAGSGRGVQRIRRGDDQYRAQVRADRTRDMVATPESGRDDLA